MSGTAVAISDYPFKSEHKLFVDANVWLFLYGPNSPPEDDKSKIYSAAFKNMLEAQSQIYIDVLIVSEFINRYARTRFHLCRKNSEQSFKKFRRSPSFKGIAKKIAGEVKTVLKHCKRIKNGFEVLDIEDIFDEYAEGNSDFNDQIIAAICKREKLQLITDDGDFKDKGISVLTANKRMLS